MDKRAKNLDPNQVRRGAQIERSEHPYLSIATATRVAVDHIIEHPYMYKKR